ncbi:hypothetical protein ACF0H5_008798 [Mactra antiquata]
MKLSTLGNLGKCAIIFCAIFECKSLNTDYNFAFISEVQELCPYTSFCKRNARLTLPKNETKEPCCKPCSCQPDCEMFGNCCFDYMRNGTLVNLRQCLSPVVTGAHVKVVNYIMVYSCQTASGSNSLCSFKPRDINSFAPVVSITTGEIYVNPQCAHCNNVTDGVPWKLSVKCPFSKEDFFITSSDILLDSQNDERSCFLTYIPPDQVNVKFRECYTNVVRQCNVTGLATQWTPMWKYCSMFNATYTYSRSNQIGAYGNIFCYICNQIRMPELLCRENELKGLDSVPFSAILEIKDFDISSFSKERDINGCDASSVMVRSFKMSQASATAELSCCTLSRAVEIGLY